MTHGAMWRMHTSYWRNAKKAWPIGTFPDVVLRIAQATMLNLAFRRSARIAHSCYASGSTKLGALASHNPAISDDREIGCLYRSNLNGISLLTRRHRSMSESKQQRNGGRILV